MNLVSFHCLFYFLAAANYDTIWAQKAGFNSSLDFQLIFFRQWQSLACR